MRGLLEEPSDGGGVTSVNSLTGAITLAAGTNITLTPAGNTITLAAAATFGAPTIAIGTLDDTYQLIIRVKDNGTARVLAWNAIFRAGNIPLPLTTVLSKTMYVKFQYNVADTKWDLIGYNDNF